MCRMMLGIFKTYILDFWQSNVKVFAMTSWTYAISINWINTTNLRFKSFSLKLAKCVFLYVCSLPIFRTTFMQEKKKTSKLRYFRFEGNVISHFFPPLQSSYLMVIGKLSFYCYFTDNNNKNTRNERLGISRMFLKFYIT